VLTEARWSDAAHDPATLAGPSLTSTWKLGGEDIVLDWSLISGAVPCTLLVLGCGAMAFPVLSRGDRRWWRAVAALAACVTAAVGALEVPTFAATEQITSHCEPYSPVLTCSNTSATARSRSSREYFVLRAMIRFSTPVWSLHQTRGGSR
jgi:hypothetical protein